jgi:hypothetical protein
MWPLRATFREKILAFSGIGSEPFPVFSKEVFIISSPRFYGDFSSVTPGRDIRHLLAGRS